MYEQEILSLKERNLFRSIRDRQSPQGNRIILRGREFINFSSNDYLGLSNHRDIKLEVIKALKKYGSGSGASRLLSGGCTLHRRLEERIASFKGTEDAILFNSGYAANTGAIPVIAKEDDLILSDELNHASIIDGCRLSRAETIIYRHRDTGHIKEIVSKRSSGIRGRIIIITDSVFSMDGDIAPLKEIYSLCSELNSEGDPVKALLYIDDAHGTGVIGGGKGALWHFGIKNEKWIIQMGTFSKALGSYGAFIAGYSDVIDWLRNNARPFIFSTALPPVSVAASLKALEILEKDQRLIERLWSNRERLVMGLEGLGFDMRASETPIVPLIFDDLEKTLLISRRLEEEGIYVPAIRPPTVKVPRLRITVTASHTEEDIGRLISVLEKIKRSK